MTRNYFMKTERLGFSRWSASDEDLAQALWGDPQVTRFITANGVMSDEQVASRLQTELDFDALYHMQYWPVFLLSDGTFAGCCGLRPYLREEKVFELGIHLRPAFWGMGLAGEAVAAVIDHAFHTLGATDLFAGHNPGNHRSRQLLERLGFHYVGDKYYEPTGLFHPSYRYRSLR